MYSPSRCFWRGCRCGGWVIYIYILTLPRGLLCDMYIERPSKTPKGDETIKWPSRPTKWPNRPTKWPNQTTKWQNQTTKWQNQTVTFFLLIHCCYLLIHCLYLLIHCLHLLIHCFYLLIHCLYLPIHCFYLPIRCLSITKPLHFFYQTIVFLLPIAFFYQTMGHFPINPSSCFYNFSVHNTNSSFVASNQ